MKRSIKSTLLSMLASFSLITGCQPVSVNTSTNQINNIHYSNIESKTIVKGKVEFPNSFPSAFTVKATLNEIAPKATVSLLYPADQPTNPNVTVATGLTDTNGNFIINPSISFYPAVNDIYVLEAAKRIGGNGNDNIAIRTFIKWNGSGWDSITTPGIYINTKTTALTVISGLNPSLITSTQTIGKMPIVNDVTTVQDISGTTVTATIINNVRSLVSTVLEKNLDPVQYIKLLNGEFTVLDPPSVNVIYVNANATGSNDGSNWANAYTSLQSALSAANSGNDIWISAGTYKPGTLVTDTFQLKDGVRIYGGFAGTETNLCQRNFNTNVVILSGDIDNNNSVNPGDSYHVVTGVTGATLDGVTIKFGFAYGLGGGGMYNNNSSPTITNVVFSNNSAGVGGGMSNINSSPTLTSVTFINNSADGGGGMMNSYSSPVLTNVTFSNNTAFYYGGGINNSINSSPTLTNVVFSNNTASSQGGGMVNQSNSSPILTNVIFSNNSSSSGGGIYNYNSPLTLINVTFSNNTASNSGGGINNWGSSSPTIKNTIFGGNTSPNGKSIKNSSTINMGYSDVEGGLTEVTGGGTIKDMTGATILDATTFSTIGYNINANPLFINSADLDGIDNILKTSDDGLSLQSSSPARNSGTAIGNTTGVPTKDITGVTRPKGSGVDMGAYEFVE